MFERARRRRAGQVDRDHPWWDEHLGIDGWQVTHQLPHNYLVHEGDDGPDGILAWTAKGEPGTSHPPLATVKVDGMFTATDIADRDLWAYLTGLDLVGRVELSGPVDEPINWLLTDARALRVTEIADHLWLKLLDVPAALAARRYAVPGELVLEIIDESEVSAGGRVRLTADGDHAAAEPTAASPDLTLAQTALAAAYLGGVSLRAQTIAGTVTEHTPGTLQHADAMFASGLRHSTRPVSDRLPPSHGHGPDDVLRVTYRPSLRRPSPCSPSPPPSATAHSIGTRTGSPGSTCRALSGAPEPTSAGRHPGPRPRGRRVDRATARR